MPNSAKLISAMILSGGQARRMKGVDKGLLTLVDKPLVQNILERLASQVNEIFINANREIAQYQAFGYPVLKDEVEGFAGPLAGISLALKYAQYDYVLTTPCDSPLLPLDLAARLFNAMLEHHADIAVVTSRGNTHPVFGLYKKNVLASLTTYLSIGERRVSTWQKSQNYIEVDFSDASDAFTNLNTFEDLEALRLKLSRSTSGYST